MAKIYLNEDNSHYFFDRGQKAADLDEIKNFIRQYQGTNVCTFLLCPSAQKVNFKNAAWECIYDNVDWDSHYFINSPNLKKWFQAVKDIDDQNMDLYGLWIEELRNIHISPWISMRMNDVHNAPELDHPMHNTFFSQHPEYYRAMYRDQQWEDRQLNYLLAPVREHAMKLIRLYFEKFDFDGIELDWMRFGNHFPPGWCDQGRDVLNVFMKQVKELALQYEKIRNHPIGIGVRVPTDPTTAFDMGMDGTFWAQEGYVDFITPSPFWATSQLDIPIEMWKKLTKGTKVKIIPCLEICLRNQPFPECKMEKPFNNLESVRAAAISWMDRGADDIYLFNYMDKLEEVYTDAEYMELLHELGDHQKMMKKKKRFILTFDDRKADGTLGNVRLPDELKKDAFHGYRLHTGNTKDGAGKKQVILSFLKAKERINDHILVYLNGQLCTFQGQINCDHPKPTQQTYSWEIKEDVFKNGYQLIEVVSQTESIVLDWVEIMEDPR